MKKSLLALCAVATLFTFVSCASTEKAETAPVESAARKAALAEDGALDLATYETNGISVKYDAEAYTLNVKDTEVFQFRLPTPLETGQSITVHITGTNNGKVGFRSWLVDDVQTTNSNLYLDLIGEGLAAGDFDKTYVLTATAYSTYVFFKGPQYGTNIDNITMKSVSVKYNQ